MTAQTHLKDIIKEIILDFHEDTIISGIPRQLEISSLPGKASICIGVRRSGKSTYMGQIMLKMLEQGVEKENILSLNFFDDRLHMLEHEDLGVILEAYFSLYPEKKNTEMVYCFFDEIQVLSHWEPFIDRLMRTERCEVYMTGSSAQMLSKEIATQMRGRAISWEMFPFSFHEILDFKNIDGKLPVSSKSRFMIEKAFESYWESGGFPEVIQVERLLRIKIHQEYFNSILFRDLIERHNIPYPKAVSDLAHYLVDHTASLYSINKLTGYLKSLGHKIPKSAVSDILVWFEDAYFLFSISIYDASHARTQANPKKIYCIDHAMVVSVGSGILVNAGRLLENLIFMSLRRVTQNIFYYKTKNGLEVDFIIQYADRTRVLIQVCETLADPDTRKREINALREAMSEMNLSSGFIVTRGEEGVVEHDIGHIQIIPAWRFILEHLTAPC